MSFDGSERRQTMAMRIDQAIDASPDIFSTHHIHALLPQGRNSAPTMRELGQKVAVKCRQGKLKRLRDGVYEKVSA